MSAHDESKILQIDTPCHKWPSLVHPRGDMGYGVHIHMYKQYHHYCTSNIPTAQERMQLQSNASYSSKASLLPEALIG